jgi:hypothetical protein
VPNSLLNKRKIFWQCIRLLCDSINDRQKKTYGDLAHQLGLPLARQEWEGLLKLIADKSKREVDDDITWIIVYATGPAKSLGRYFSNGGKPSGSTLLDPKNQKQVDDYNRTLKRMFKNLYDVRDIEGKTCIVKEPRSK